MLEHVTSSCMGKEAAGGRRLLRASLPLAWRTLPHTRIRRILTRNGGLLLLRVGLLLLRRVWRVWLWLLSDRRIWLLRLLNLSRLRSVWLLRLLLLLRWSIGR
jgi:hypothetical protein